MGRYTKDSLGERQKGREISPTLEAKVPVVIRCDGRAFHTLTRHLEKPFDKFFMDCMRLAALKVCEDAQGCKLAYVQSDEVSFLLSDLDNDASQPWFGNNLQKITTIAASTMSAWFSKLYGKIGVFDGRAFNIPVEDVENYFVWRQQDAIRNSIRMVGHAYFSPKSLNQVNNKELLEKLDKEKGINYYSFNEDFRNGTLLYNEEIDFGDYNRHSWEQRPSPLFIDNRDLIREQLTVKEIIRQ
jgi:tRNA(His) 5'-end guanylyltransferase